jgi:putative transposase
MRYAPHPRADEGRVRERLGSLAGRHPRYGYRRLHVLLQRELGRITRKRVYRLSRLEGRKVRRQKRKRVAVTPRVPSERVWKRAETWAMDFMLDTLADGRRFRTLNVLDIVTRECLAIEVDTSLPGERVVRVLDQLITWYGVPKQLTIDNGPEFAGQLLDTWAYAHEVTLDFIEPGKPTQNGYLESFNGKFRDECLNMHGLRQFGTRQSAHPDLEGGVPPRATAERLTAPGSSGLRSSTSNITLFLIIRGPKPGFRSAEAIETVREGAASALRLNRDFGNYVGFVTTTRRVTAPR